MLKLQCQRYYDKMLEARNKMLLTQNKMLETKIKMLEASLKLERNTEEHACQSGAILHDLLDDMNNLRMK